MTWEIRGFAFHLRPLIIEYADSLCEFGLLLLERPESVRYFVQSFISPAIASFPADVLRLRIRESWHLGEPDDYQPHERG